MLQKLEYTAPPATPQTRVVTGQWIAKAKLNKRERAKLAAQWLHGMIEVKPTVAMAVTAFKVSQPYISEAVNDLKAATKNGNGSNGAGANDGIQLSLDDLWTSMDADAQAMFAHRNLSSVWAAIENVT